MQMPHATVHSSDVADAWFAWHSMPKRAARTAKKKRRAFTRPLSPRVTSSDIAVSAYKGP